MISLAALALMSLIVQPNDRPMYAVESLSPDICEEMLFIAENGKTRARHEAEMAAYLKANPNENSYGWAGTGTRAYCVVQNDGQNVNIIGNSGNANANATATSTGGEGGNANNVNVSGNQGTVDIVSPAIQTGAALPKKKTKAPAGCGTTLACGGYDEY